MRRQFGRSLARSCSVSSPHLAGFMEGSRLGRTYRPRRKARCALVLLLTLLVASGCLGCANARHQGTVTAKTDHHTAVVLVPMPVSALRLCRASTLIRAACPTRVPRVPRSRSKQIARYAVQLCRGGKPGCFSVGTDLFNLQRGGEDPLNPRHNRPPRMVHLVIFGGNLSRAFPFVYPTRARVRVHDGLMKGNRSHPVYFGHVRFGNRRGTLVLAPPGAPGGLQANHVIFRWRRSDAELAVGLHAWEPFTEAVATLRRIVDSIPARP
jgi:hypothetical protein